MTAPPEPQSACDNYKYASSVPAWDCEFLWILVRQALESRLPQGARVLDLGCGSGTTAGLMAALGYEVVGVDPSESGIAHARMAHPNVSFAKRSAYDDLVTEFGQFDAVVSLEVVEHCYSPQAYARTVFDVLRSGGRAIISTPFHGYWKNLALALTGRFDCHWSPLWEGGHIKFWSETTISELLHRAGFVDIRIGRVGRIRPFAKSMVVMAVKP